MEASSINNLPDRNNYHTNNTNNGLNSNTNKSSINTTQTNKQPLSMGPINNPASELQWKSNNTEWHKQTNCLPSCPCHEWDWTRLITAAQCVAPPTTTAKQQKSGSKKYQNTKFEVKSTNTIKRAVVGHMAQLKKFLPIWRHPFYAIHYTHFTFYPFYAIHYTAPRGRIKECRATLSKQEGSQRW